MTESTPPDTARGVEHWSTAVHRELKTADIRQVAFVPDAGHAELIRLCADDEALRTVTLTTEEEGVAMLAGAWLGGQRGVLLMQSSGVGNCVNMLALQQECRIPLLTLVTMRGTWGEFNPWQVPMGQTTARVLAIAGVTVHPVTAAEDVAPTVAAACRYAFDARRAAAVLIDQRVIGTKHFPR